MRRRRYDTHTKDNFFLTLYILYSLARRFVLWSPISMIWAKGIAKNWIIAVRMRKHGDSCLVSKAFTRKNHIS